MANSRARVTLPGLKLAAVIGSLLATAAMARSESFHFDITNPNMSAALREYAKVSGEQIIFTEDLVAGVAAAPLTGDYTAGTALNQLLTGTNLVTERSPSGALMIRASSQTQSPPQSSIRLAQAEPAQAAAVDEDGAAALRASASGLTEVVVTGSRILRDGYEAPTPLTIVGAEVLQQSASSNIGDALRTMPGFSGGITPTSGVGTPSSLGAGLNTLDLRAMGSNRTLILIDGQRTVTSRIDGAIDINNIPQQLVSRVDVVTGGASAVYGSDAVSGVVNFILDKEFTGVKGEFSSGMTSYGDDEDYKIALTAGTPFADGRGHFIISGEHFEKTGIHQNRRSWNQGGRGIIRNPNYDAQNHNGEPEYFVRDDVSMWYTKGGIIDRGALQGIAFGQGGTPYMFNFGDITSGIFTAGGDWRDTLIRSERKTLDPTSRRNGLFTRLSYDLTDNVEVFAQVAWNSSYDRSNGLTHYQAGNGPTILSGNPFIPASVQEQMTALGLASFHIGSMNYDLPIIGNLAERTTNRNVIGINGTSNFFNTDWTWNAYFQNGVTDISFDVTGVTRRSRRALAVDAVIDPTTGAIVCRSTLTDPNNGCIPYNPMGIGVNGPEAINYLTGGVNAHVDQELSQNVTAASITGEPFSTWAGPVSIALSAEHRTEKAVSEPDEVTSLRDWQAGNFLPLDAKMHVSEAAIEALIPLVSGAFLADSLNLSTAFRATEYSTSGYVSTWKVGMTYSPIADVTFRATRSRDIRAPNLGDLYQQNVTGFNGGYDPFTQTTPTFLVSVNGNPNLKPEIGDTTNVGVVLQPSFAPGLSLAVDLWNIKLSDALATPSFNQILQFCYEGQAEYCSNISRTDGVVTGLIQSPFNMAVQETRGIDFEASYRLPLSSINAALPGDLGLRLYVTKYLKNYIDNNLSTPYDSVGENRAGAPPDWNATGRLEYSLDRFSASLTARAMSSGTMYHNYVSCEMDCPISTLDNPTIDSNKLDGFVYLDAGLSYDLDVGAARAEVFLNIRNLLNKDPEIVPNNIEAFIYGGELTNVLKYDFLGRIYRAGVRIQF